MRRSWIYSFLAGFCLLTSLLAAPPAGYYDAATGLTGGPLKQALHGIVANQTVIPYGSLIAPLTVIWRDPANPANILLIYSHTSVPANSTWNREHLWPRARGNTDQAGPDDSDLFHVVPADNAVNADRGSLYYDESDPNDPGYKIPANPLAPQTSRDSDSWQPPPQERGEIARALFYMDMRYDGQEAQTTDFDLVSFPPTGSQMGRLNTLLLWNEQYPPDDAERARNDLIYTNYQHNRNPFIDHPEWVSAIWGTGTASGGSSQPIARLNPVIASAVENPSIAAVFLVALNQFAGPNGLTVSFSMAGTAQLDEYVLSGAGVTFDPSTGLGTVFIPANYSSAQVVLTPVNDGVAEPVETAIATLQAADGYISVPNESSSTTLTISDAPSLPCSWNFDSPPYSNPLPANSGAGSISFVGWHGTVTYFSGSSGQALALVGSAGNGSWIDLRLSMTGYTNLQVSFSTRGTSAGFSSGTWSASTDGVNFTALAGVNTATQNGTFSQKQVDFSSLAALTDAPDVTLRYTLSGATGSAANNRIDDLRISAAAYVTGNGPRTVTLAAATPTASETTLSPGAFSVQLNGPAPVGGLDIGLSFSGGTATSPGLPDADYSLSGLTSYDPDSRAGHLFIAEGQRAAIISVTPIADSQVEGSETVFASLLSSSAYLVGTNSPAIVTITEPPANDNFANAALLSGITARAAANNSGATRETNEPAHNGSSGTHSLWWSWTAPASGVVSIDTKGSTFDTVLAVYTGSQLANLSVLGSNDDSGGNLTSLLNLTVQAQRTYFIAVDGYSTSTGQISLQLNFAPTPVVRLSVLAGTGRERGNVPATVRFTLSNRIALPLTLSYSLRGSATPGTDYTASSGSFTTLTIPANTDSGDLSLTPLTDANPIEGTETIHLALNPSANYTLDSSQPNNVDLTLEDDTPYSAAWLAQHPALSVAAAQPFSDLDGDGVPALLEYIGNRDPGSADSAPILKIDEELFPDPSDGNVKTYAAIRFLRRLDASGIPLVLEVNHALSNSAWVPGGVLLSRTPQPGGETEELLYRGDTPLDDPANSATFYRLRATLP